MTTATRVEIPRTVTDFAWPYTAGNPFDEGETVDVQVENHGTLFLFRPLNANAWAWLDENTDARWFGEALVVEHRYAADLAAGMQADGFVLQ